MAHSLQDLGRIEELLVELRPQMGIARHNHEPRIGAVGFSSANHGGSQEQRQERSSKVIDLYSKVIVSEPLRMCSKLLTSTPSRQVSSRTWVQRWQH